MYRKTVVMYNSGKYTKTPANIVQALFVHDSSYHKTDDNDLKQGNLPVQSVVNNIT